MPRLPALSAPELMLAHPPRFLAGEHILGVDALDRQAFQYPHTCGPEFWEGEIKFSPAGTEVAAVNGEVIGYVHTNVRDWEDGHCGEITSLVIAESYRGQGIGTFLLRRGMERLLERGLTTLKLYTGVNNERMQRIARRMGFAVHQIMPDFIPPPQGPEDAFLMLYRAED